MQTTIEDIWREIEQKTKQFESLHLQKDLDFEKSAIYSIIAHSTAIEGSTLTEQEAKVLFEKGLTAKDKPLSHHLMNIDLKDAYMFSLEQAEETPVFTSDFLKKLNSLVTKSNFDNSKGDFKLSGASVGIGDKSYSNYLQVSEKINKLCENLNDKLNMSYKYLRELYEIAFNVHLNLVTIHPWASGNGRTARLLMNFLQFYFKILPTNTFSEDRVGYIAALRESDKAKNHSVFLKFMALQHLKTISTFFPRKM